MLGDRVAREGLIAVATHWTCPPMIEADAALAALIYLNATQQWYQVRPTWSYLHDSRRALSITCSTNSLATAPNATPCP